MTSLLHKRSLRIAGHMTSVALEPLFWTTLEEMAAARGASLSALVVAIDAERGLSPLTSALRVSALAWLRGQVRGSAPA